MMGTLTPLQVLSGTLTPEQGVSGSLSAFAAAYFPEYDGPTEFTPTGEPQTIATSGRSVRTDLTINPIPRNYGLITDLGGGRISVS